MAITIELDSNYDNIRKSINQALRQIIDNQEPILLAAASGILSLVHTRIHEQGKRANGSAIGQYANSYMRVREQNNRGTSRDIILSLTRQMENDFNVVSSGGSTGLGFNNPVNFQKAGWMEERFPGTYLLSDDEEQELVLIISDYINGIFE